MSEAADVPDLSGAVLSGAVRLVRLVGVGGMGVVYEASTTDGRRVAVKLLRPEFLDDGNVHARFLEEGKMCLGLVHPNIVRVLDVGVAEDQTPYLVMEYLDGVPLSAYTAKGTKTSWKHALPILIGVLRGLAFAHGRGIVHRDLKPENIFLARDAQGRFVPKVLDFGVAKVLDAAGGMGKRTSTGMLLGTPAYMSPEQIQNARDVDPRSDLFSAGTILYEMVSGRTAFDAPTEFERLAAVLSVFPPPLLSLEPGLTALSNVVSRAMEKDRAARFSSAAEMADALALLSTGDGSELLFTMPPPPTGSVSTKESLGPHGTLASAPEKVSAPVFPVRSVIVDPPRFVSPAHSSPSRGIPLWGLAAVLAVGIGIGVVLTLVATR